jgi:hypothetical protein
MKLRIKISRLKKDNIRNNENHLKIIEDENFLIEKSYLQKKWKKKNGDLFFLIGDIIGKRNKDKKLKKITNYSREIYYNKNYSKWRCECLD